jgi:quaternary ammonium compound-resistance protein SugE
MNWLVLILAGLVEIVWAVGIRYTENWTRPVWCAIVILAYAAGLYFLSYAMRTIPTGTAYAVWVGIGTVGITLWGILVGGEAASALRLVCIALILAGVIGLKAA